MSVFSQFSLMKKTIPFYSSSYWMPSGLGMLKPIVKNHCRYKIDKLSRLEAFVAHFLAHVEDYSPDHVVDPIPSSPDAPKPSPPDPDMPLPNPEKPRPQEEPPSDKLPSLPEPREDLPLYIPPDIWWPPIGSFCSSP